eukprot:m.59599 g.59599  ORF g.59599 m.59599 type:complete len:166 (-) comp11777_c0_seq5:164-661(-)
MQRSKLQLPTLWKVSSKGPLSIALPAPTPTTASANGRIRSTTPCLHHGSPCHGTSQPLHATPTTTSAASSSHVCLPSRTPLPRPHCWICSPTTNAASALHATQACTISLSSITSCSPPACSSLRLTRIAPSTKLKRSGKQRGDLQQEHENLINFLCNTRKLMVLN